MIDYHTEYYHVFLDLARAFQSCHNSLSAVNDSYYDTGYLLHLRSFAEYLDVCIPDTLRSGSHSLRVTDPIQTFMWSVQTTLVILQLLLMQFSAK